MFLVSSNQLFLAILVQVKNSYLSEIKFTSFQIYFQILDLICPFQLELSLIQMKLIVVQNIVDPMELEIIFCFPVTPSTPVSFNQIRLKRSIEVNHVCTEGIEIIISIFG